MKHIKTVFFKELLDMLRDKRTIIFTIIFPLLLTPAIVLLYSKFTSNKKKDAAERNIIMGVISNSQSPELITQISKVKGLTLQNFTNANELKTKVKNDEIDLGLVLDSNFNTKLSSNGSAVLTVYSKPTDDEIIWERVKVAIDAFKANALNNRYIALNIPPSVSEPIIVKEESVLNTVESIGKMMGGFLPYLFVLTCLAGAINPALDLFAGEKERSTLETLLTTPVNRIYILIGKLLLITVFGIISGFLSLTGIAIAAFLAAGNNLPPEITSTLSDLLSVKKVILILLMILPLNIFFAAVLSSISVYAKTFKEAQSLSTPLTFVALVPLMIGTLPFMELNLSTAFIPILNVSLACKDIIANTLNIWHYTIVLGSLLLLATAALIFCFKWFDKESNILRT